MVPLADIARASAAALSGRFDAAAAAGVAAEAAEAGEVVVGRLDGAPPEPEAAPPRPRVDRDLSPPEREQVPIAPALTQPVLAEPAATRGRRDEWREAGQAEAAEAAEAGLLTQRREWEEVVCHRRQLSLEASERTDPER